MELRATPNGFIYAKVSKRFAGDKPEVLIREVYPQRRGYWWVTEAWWSRLSPVRDIPKPDWRKEGKNEG
jgi:hypothetical protein